MIRSLNRIAGSEKMAVELIRDLEDRGVLIRSLTEPAIDTTTPMGRALCSIVAVLAQLRVDTSATTPAAAWRTPARRIGSVAGRR